MKGNILLLLTRIFGTKQITLNKKTNPGNNPGPVLLFDDALDEEIIYLFGDILHVLTISH